MLKFDLARKYLVGLLTVAMVFSLFTLPMATAAPEPTANVTTWSVTVSPTSDLNPVDSPTHVVTIYTTFGGTLATPTNNVAVATATSVVISPSIAATWTSTGVYTATVVYGVDVPAVPGTYKIYGFIDADTSGGISEGDVISDAVTKTWEDRAPHDFTVLPQTSTNTLTTGADTHTITIVVKDQFGDPIDATTVTVAVTGFNTVAATTNVNITATGTYTFTYTSTDPSNSNPNGVYSFTDTISVTVDDLGSKTVYKTWTYTPTFTIALTPLTDTNPLTPPGNTHLVTATCTDQFGRYPPTGTPIVFSVSGKNTQTVTKSTDATGTATFSYTNTATTDGTDNITVTKLGDYTFTTNTVTKTWEARTPSGYTVTTTSPAYNMVGDKHPIVIKLLDQFGQVYTGTTFTGTIEVVYHNSETITRYVTFQGTGTVTVNLEAIDGGWDHYRVSSVTPSYGFSGSNWFDKFWAHEYSVTPLEEINVIGSNHNVNLKGAPFQHFTGQLYSADGFGLVKITGFQGSGTLTVNSNINTYYFPPGPETDFNYSFTFSGYLDSTGSATITFYSKDPRKFYMEVNFDPSNGNIYENNWSGSGYDLTKFNSLRTNTVTRYQVAKIFALIDHFSLTPTYKFNEVTTDTTLNKHTLNVEVWGKYYWNGEWHETTLGNVKVDWTITWTDPFQRKVSDRYVDGATVQDGTTPLKATTYTDADGKSYLEYYLDITGTPSYHIAPLFDSITAFVHYSDAVLDVNYPPPSTQTATKEWRDYGYKLIKVENNDYTKTLTGVPFYLKTETGTYYYGDPSNAHIGDSSGYLVTTDTYGAAIWYHLPAGTYDVYEIVPSGYVGEGTSVKVDTFTVPDIGFWNGSGTLYTKYISNTPTRTIPQGYVYFWKFKWDRPLPIGGAGTPTVASGVVFKAVNQTTSQEIIATSSATGLVEFKNLTVGTTTEWYKVSEITPPAGFMPVPDFYFYIPPSGTWDEKFYVDMTISSTHELDYVYPALFTEDGKKLYDYRGQVEFYKLTYCYQNLPGAIFTFTNLSRTDWKVTVTSSTATGMVLSGLLPVTNSATTWYKVSETFVPAGYLPVSDFYFYLAPDGTWNNKFYDAASLSAAEVWPLAPRPESGDTRHWVIDPAAQAAITTQVVIDPATSTLNFPSAPSLNFTVIVTDQLGNGIPNKSVTPVTDFGTITAINATTDILGKAQFTITVTGAGVAHISATVDGKTGTATYTWTALTLNIENLTATPTEDIAAWRPIQISATSPLAGNWSGKVYNPSGVEIGTLPAATGTAYNGSWAPAEGQAFAGSGYYAVLQLTDGVTTKTATVYFSMYNYKIKILSVTFLDAAWNLITNPTAGQPFYVKVEIENTYTGVVATTFIPVVINSNYIGAGGLGGLAAGQTGEAYILCSGLSAGTYTGYAYVWVNTGGTPIAVPWSFTVTVNP